MISTSSVRRIKERGGGGGKITGMATVTKPAKTITPVSDKSIRISETHKRPTGKENPRSISRVRAATTATLQKPTIRPMPRIDKSGDKMEALGDARTRRSTSSVPRGRSSSPFESNRVLSDLRKNSRVSVDGVEKGSKCEIARSVSGVTRVSEKNQQRKGGFKVFNKEVRLTEKCEIGITALKESSDSVNLVVDSEKTREICKESDLKSGGSEKSRAWVLHKNGEVNSRSNSDKSHLDCSDDAIAFDSVKVSDKAQIFEESKQRTSVILKSGCVILKSVNGGDLGSKEFGGKLVNRLSGSEVLKENGVIGEGANVGNINKYQSKLHEKLACLEGKVKRIASDIKRTKEMLDMNNPDASKVILCDIQEKISGIEKAMGNVVVNGADGKMGLSDINVNDNQQVNVSEKGQVKQADHMKSLVKGLNGDELEARFFPHHKLLRDRTSLKPSSGSSQTHELKIVKSTSDLKMGEKSLGPIDENRIALEFLASLNTEQLKVTTRGGNVDLGNCEVQEMDDAMTSAAHGSSSNFNGKGNVELILTSDETLDEFDDQENRRAMVIEEIEDSCIYPLNEIGRKTSTGGWFVAEGESVLLAHDDGSCSFYDIANCEEKAEYKPPAGVSPNVWRDCWIIRAPGADGCSGRYVVAASAGNAIESGFCSWDFYTKDVRAFHIEDLNTNTRMVLAPLSNSTVYRRNALSPTMVPENQQWWYKPCGPLMISTASYQKAVRIYDIRDGEQIMKWEVQKPVLAMDYSSPLQWRNRGKVVLAEAETISLWDVSSLNPQALLSVSSSGRQISALHVNNTDAELGGGVRQRVSSSETEGNDGVFCTPDSINVLDFRHPSGVGLKIPKVGLNVQSVFSRGDSIFIGCTNLRSAGKMHSSQVQQFSLRKQSLASTFELPELNAHLHYAAITQVWGNSNSVMGICGLGLFVFDALKDDVLQSLTIDYGNTQKVRERIGPDDLYFPSFDCLASRVLLISRDRPALWRYLP